MTKGGLRKCTPLALYNLIAQCAPYTASHQVETAKIVQGMAVAMGLQMERAKNAYYAALLHDVGKLTVPNVLLTKPGTIGAEEFALIKTHCLVGKSILDEFELPEGVRLACFQHHERLDGSGYPNGLSGEGICLEARMVAVADVFESMTSDRPYRKRHTADEAFEEIEGNCGRLYDPAVVLAFVNAYVPSAVNQ
jgi:putative nucleotidyltransferase with HDIG domain